MIDYRAATREDAPGLDAMAQASWLETFGRFYSAEDRDAYLATAYGPEGRLCRDLTNPDAAIRIACTGGGIIGYAKVERPWLPDAEPGALQLSQIYVLSGWHGTGVGAALMDWAVAHARGQGASALLLTVWEENHRGMRFYERRGFVHVGDYGFPVGSRVDRDLVLELAL